MSIKPSPVASNNPECTQAPSQSNASKADGPMTLGRYVLCSEIASGGMASVHLGFLNGAEGFSRTVAIKRLHKGFAHDPEFVAMFLDEARLAARVHHPNVTQVLDVVAQEGELFLVMEYIRGDSLSGLLRTLRANNQPPPISIIASVMSGVLHGLHAAHEARSAQGTPLEIVHRDVSPQNILVGVDGVARLVDFGIAKASDRAQLTTQGQVKGKLDYMAPEQIELGDVTRRADVYAAAVVLWEALAGRRMFEGSDVGSRVRRILFGDIEPPSKHNIGLSKKLDALVMRGLQRDPAQRFQTAHDMAIALEQAAPCATPAKVGEWVENTVPDEIRRRDDQLTLVESHIDARPCDLRIEVPVEIEQAPREGQSLAATSASIIAARSTLIPFAISKRRFAGIVVGAALAGLATAVIALSIGSRTPLTRPAVANGSEIVLVAVSASEAGSSTASPAMSVAAAPTTAPVASTSRPGSAPTVEASSRTAPTAEPPRRSPADGTTRISGVRSSSTIARDFPTDGKPSNRARK